jgi:hypothetical protein
LGAATAVVPATGVRALHYKPVPKHIFTKMGSNKNGVAILQTCTLVGTGLSITIPRKSWTVLLLMGF